MRIALLEDDPTQAGLVVGWLQAAGHDVHHFPLTRELMRFATHESVDLFLLDWMLPDQTGESFLKWLRQERQNKTPAIFLTARESEEDIVTGLSLGADDYIGKPVAERILLARIASVMRRAGTQASSTRMEFGAYVFDQRGKVLTLNGQAIELTEKEFDLAHFLFRNLGRLLSRGHLLESVWGRSADLATRTVDTHISRVRSKLALRPENGFRLTPTYNYGYRLEQVADEEAPAVADPA